MILFKTQIYKYGNPFEEFLFSLLFLEPPQILGYLPSFTHTVARTDSLFFLGVPRAPKPFSFPSFVYILVTTTGVKEESQSQP